MPRRKGLPLSTARCGHVRGMDGGIEKTLTALDQGVGCYAA